VENPNPIIKSVSRREWASLRTGATGGVLRLVLQSLTGTGASIEYDAYIQYAKNVTPPPSPYAADVQGFDGWPPEEEAKKREGGLTDKEKAYWDAEKKRLEEDERREKAEAKEKEKGGGLDRDAETKKTTVSPVSPGRR
jgi:hypothetical protein